MNANNNDTMDVDEGPPKFPPLPQVEEEDEWMYVMRRSMQEIVPGLFLGPYGAATRSSLNQMKQAGLTHVVCVRSEIEAHVIRANHMDHFQYLIVQMDDPPKDALIPKVKTVSAFIENCLNTGGKVLVHGNAGMSRSAAIVVGYLMSKYGVNFRKARRYVQSKRFCICINDVCANQLREYEPIYLAMHTLSHQSGGNTLAGYTMTKRKIDEMEGSDDENTDNNKGHRPRMEVFSPDEPMQ